MIKRDEAKIAALYSALSVFGSDIRNDLDALINISYGSSKACGWHDTEREDGTMIALIHSELSEALEGIRKNKMDDHLPQRPNAEVELADAVIRIFDFARKKGYDLAGAWVEKSLYNLSRPDHKPEAREAEGGKKF